MEVPDSNILTLFFEICRRQPKRTAARDGKRKLSYRKLELASYAVAQRLTQMGVSRGDVVPVVAKSSLPMVIGVLGVLRSGATYVPLDFSQWPSSRITSTITRLHARIVLYTGPEVDLGPDVIGMSVKSIMRAPYQPTKDIHGACITDPQRDDLACIIFTSGTTGEPKGVMLRHSSVLHFVTSPPFNYNVTPRDRVLLALSCAFDACMGTLFSVLCNGGCIVIANGSNLRERVKQCTIFVGTPPMLESLDQPQSPSDYPFLEKIVLGGETPTRNLIQKWITIEKPIWIAYGPTEATCATLTGEITLPGSSDFLDPRILGLPIADSTVTIVDGNLKPIISLEEEGELLISGPGLAVGYWCDERLTREKFIILDGKPTYRTGDYGKWVEDSYGRRTVYFCGRKDRTVKIRGFLVNLETDVDAAILKQVPGVNGVLSYNDGASIYTAVTPGHLSEASLISHIRLFLPHYMVPERIIALERFPQNAYGKTDIRTLQNLLSQKLQCGVTQNLEEIKSTQLGKDLLCGLSEALPNSAKNINPTLSFIGNGIYSLTAVRLCFYLRNRGYSFKPADFLCSKSINLFIRTNHIMQPKIVFDNADLLLGKNTDIKMAPLTLQQLGLVHGTLKCAHFNVVNHISECESQYLYRLKEAWARLEQIEPIFRTKIDLYNGQYLQKLEVKPRSVWSDLEIDIRELEGELQAIAANTGFGHQFTVLTVRGTSKAMIVWSVHHALMDGFSAALILKKLEQILHGDSISPSISFPSIVHSLQATSDRQKAASRLFWGEQERLFPQACGDLPIAQPQSSNTSETHHAISVIFDGSTVDEVARYCALENVTPAAIHYATWSLVLAIYTGSENVVFGAIFSGRDRGDCSSDSIIGCLLDTLPFRNHVSRCEVSAKFTRRTHELLHSVSQFHGSSYRTNQTSYSTAVSCDPSMPKPANLGFLSHSRVVQYPDLPMIAIVREDGSVSLLYKRENYCEEDIIELGEMYRNIFTMLLSRHLTIWDVLKRKYTVAGEDSILTLGNFHREESYINPRPATIVTMFDEATALYATDVAIEKGESVMTYAQVKQVVDHLALILRSHVQPGDTVCVLADRSTNWIIGLFAVLKLAAVYCPVDVGHSRCHQTKIIQYSNAKLLLFDRVEQAQLFPQSLVPCLCISEVLQSPKPHVCTGIQRCSDPNDVAFLVFTSGSTGEPKGILIEHRSLVALQYSYRALFNTARRSRIAQFLSPGFDVAMQEIVWSLCSGGTLVLRKDAENPFSHISDVDTIMLTPSVATNLDPKEYPNIRYIHLAGEPVAEQVVKSWDAPGREIFNIYGPAETTVVTCAQRLKSGEPVSLGPPLPSVRLYILNEQSELLPPGVIGNIYVAGIQVSRGYVNNQSKTWSAFLVDPFASYRSPAERMYYTGDLGYLDRHGRVHYCGRKDRQIKLRGFRTNLDDIAHIVQRLMPTVKRAFATERDGRVILWTEPGEVNTTKLRELLSTSLPAHALPSHIVALGRLPLNANGKVDCKRLAQMDLPVHRQVIPSQTSQLSPDESLIAEEWRCLLGLEKMAPIHAHDSFMAMGGHSVLQLALVARLKEKFKVPMTIREVIGAPTLRSIAAVVSEKRSVGGKIDDKVEKRSPLGRQRLSPPELEWYYRYRSAEQLSAFNVPFVTNLPPSTDVIGLKASIEHALARHEVLRSHFISHGDGEPQRVLSQDPILVRMAEEDFDIQEFVNQPFDLSRDCLVRVVLTRSLLAFSISHIVMDLTALQQLLSDVIIIYNAGCGSINPSPRQYFEVNQWNNSADIVKITFWRSYLETTTPNYRCQRPRRSYRGGGLFSNVPDDIYRQIVSRVTEQQISLHQFALSAISLVLQSLVRHGPIVVGSPYINRNIELDQSVVGLFLEPLPIRIDWPHLTQGYTGDLLQATKTSSQSALAHAIPWPTLLQALDIPFPSKQQEVFDVVVTVHDNRHGGIHLAIPDMVLTGNTNVQRIWPDGAKFPLCFEVEAQKERLTVRLEYDTDIMHVTHALVLQNILLVAICGLLEPQLTYVGIMKRMEGALRDGCKEQQVSVEELAGIAKAHLV